MRSTRRRIQTPLIRKLISRVYRFGLAGSIVAVAAGCSGTSLKNSTLAKSASPNRENESRFAWARIRAGSGAASVSTQTANVKNPSAPSKTPAVSATTGGADGKGPKPWPPVVLASNQQSANEPSAVAPAATPANSTTATVPLETVAAPALVASEPMISSRRAAVLMSPYGVGPDQPGLADNVSARVGMTYFDVARDNAVGGSIMLESSAQLGQSDRFVHGGFGAEFLDNEWPMSSTIGFSKLARIEGDCVVKPGIFSVAYDSYYDTSYFGTNDNIYIDQIRLLAGWAVSPRADVGMWAAIGLRGDGGTITTPAGVGFIPARFGDRVAGYVSANVGKSGSLLIASAGWEQGPGRFFAETDLFVPLTESVNLFGGFGYSDAKFFDAIVGLELLPSGWKGRRKRVLTDECLAGDPCAEVCVASACDPCPPCGPNYRGGWANGNYRGALRLISPARMRRMIEDPNLHLPGAVAAPIPPPPGVVLPPDVPREDPPAKPDPGQPPVGGQEPPQQPPTTPPDVCPPAPETPDICLPRVLTRPTRPSTLSQLLQSGGHLP